jgi:hypothetical protein
LLGWGVGLAIHALVALTASEEDFREHDEAMKWWHENQRRRHDVPTALSEREPTSEPSLERVRVAPADTGREHDADEEVTGDARAQQRRR